MATYFNTEVKNGQKKAGVKFAGDPTALILFNASAPLSGSVLSASFIDTAGINGKTTQIGHIEIDGTYQGETFYVQLNDRQVLGFTVPGAAAKTNTTVTPIASGHAITGPTHNRLRLLGNI